jgi:hypothetical protein
LKHRQTTTKDCHARKEEDKRGEGEEEGEKESVIIPFFWVRVVVL